VTAAIDLYWLPLGAGGHSVRFNGRAFEALVSYREHRAACDLYHSALRVLAPAGRFVIEMTPEQRVNPPGREVFATGPVGARWAAHLRLFRYQVHLWRDGTIADSDEAVDSPRRLTVDAPTVLRLLGETHRLPTPVWGRDELLAGEMWNSNSVTSWLLERCGLDANAITPPLAGRAPGWHAGVLDAKRLQNGDLRNPRPPGK
jgi:hypothetical protein